MTPPPPPPAPTAILDRGRAVVATNGGLTGFIGPVANGGDKDAPRIAAAHKLDIRAADASGTSATTVDPVAKVVLDAFRVPTGPPADPAVPESAQLAGLAELAAAATSDPPAAVCRYSLPSFLLYDARGLQLFDAITKLPDDVYYLTGCEASILGDEGGAAAQIARDVPEGAVVLELGCGSMRKTRLLLEAMELSARDRGFTRPIHFYALDLDRGELEKSLAALAASPPANSKRWSHISFHGLVGTYEQGLSALRTTLSSAPQRVVLWLGSSIGNLTRAAAVTFLSSIRAHTQPHDRLVLGADHRNPRALVERAYNDPYGVTREFTLNLIDHINAHLAGDAPLPPRAFEFAPVYNTRAGRHEVYLRVLEPVDAVLAPADPQLAAALDPVRVRLARGELVHVEYSYKYNDADLAALLARSQWAVDAAWEDKGARYGLHLLSPAAIALSHPSPAPSSIPSLAAWDEVWRAFDFVTLRILRRAALAVRAIDVRHPFVFYVGHLPCFADVQLARALGEPATGPEAFPRIFERGIDPDLDDPTVCHPHSEVPETWPAVDEVVKYRDMVRERVRRVTVAGEVASEVAHALNMAFEHDAMHLETILYMVLQLDPSLVDATTLPPCLRAYPADYPPLPPAASLMVPRGTVVLGRSPDDGVFGWDNEFPASAPLPVGALAVQSRPVSVGEYAAFLRESGRRDLVPSSWKAEGEEWHVRSLAHAGGWLSIARNEQRVRDHAVSGISRLAADAYAAWWNRRFGSPPDTWRVPTEPEWVYARDLLAPGGEQPVCAGMAAGGVWGTAPMPVTSGGDAEWTAGGVWEWTATPFAPHGDRDAWRADPAYPGYSADFFDDGKHGVVLGASWATHPRLATRRSFRNWFQAGYMYAAVGVRLVKSVE
ncbi:hypothetical protein H9P43_004050 [Blastocladiella emersonii ATCC 22665]|nr:hypothetical protein H9P43_004050 [Blastocladiella emersonii ATCC 22665]